MIRPAPLILGSLLLAASLLPAGCARRRAAVSPEEGGTLAPAWTVTIDAASGIQVTAAPGGFLAATPAGVLMKIAAADGAVSWKIDLGARTAGSLVVAPGPAGHQEETVAAVPLEGGKIALVALASGETAGRVETGWESVMLAAAHERIVAISREGHARLYRIGSSDPVWERVLPSAPGARGEICTGRLMVGLADGHLVGVDLETGEIRIRKNLGSPAMVAPECREKRIYVATADNYLHALRLYRRSAGVKWRIRSGADPAAPPLTFKNDVLLLSKDTFLYGFQKRNGHLVFRAHLDRRPGPAAILDDLIFVAGPQSTRLDAYRLPRGHGAGTFTLPEAARFITPPVASEGRVAIAVAKYGEETSKLVGLGPKAGPASPGVH